MRLQSAIFDMDGTLLDSMNAWKNSGRDMLRKLGYHPTDELQQKIKTMTMWEVVACYKETFHMPQSEAEIVDLIRARMEEFYSQEVQLKPGAKEFLSLMKMEGVWMYIATATDRRLAEIALAHTGIRDYFRGILTCSEVGHGKESPQIFEGAMRRLHSTKKDTIVFEDALFALKTAKRAGFRVAAVYDPSAEEDQEEIKQISDYYIRSYEEMFNATDLL